MGLGSLGITGRRFVILFTALVGWCEGKFAVASHTHHGTCSLAMISGCLSFTGGRLARGNLPTVHAIIVLLLLYSTLPGLLTLH